MRPCKGMLRGGGSRAMGRERPSGEGGSPDGGLEMRGLTGFLRGC